MEQNKYVMTGTSFIKAQETRESIQLPKQVWSADIPNIGELKIKKFQVVDPNMVLSPNKHLTNIFHLIYTRNKGQQERGKLAKAHQVTLIWCMDQYQFMQKVMGCHHMWDIYEQNL